jgi:CRP/FNR family transcriptional regulator, nitrogen oxide reductase regulator
MIENIDLQQLKKIPFFAKLGETEWQAVLEAGRVQVVEADAFLFYQDDPAENVYVVVDGRIKLTQLSPEGQQVIMRVATDWMMIAIIGIVKGTVYPVSAEAAETSRVLVWSQTAMLELAERFPVLALNALKLMAQQVREFQDRYRELATERVERRLARTIIRLAAQTGKKTDEGVLLDLPLTRQDLAEMTGTTLYTVSRILTQWEEKGLILSRRERVVIRFPHGLVQIAEDLPGRENEKH